MTPPAVQNSTYDHVVHLPEILQAINLQKYISNVLQQIPPQKFEQISQCSECLLYAKCKFVHYTYEGNIYFNKGSILYSQ